MRRAAALALTGLCLGLAGLAACDNMANQPKRLPYELPYGARGDWPVSLPAGIVAHDDKPVPPPPVTLALLQHGRQRFDIYCAPCHGPTGDGHGMVVERGFPQPPSYHSDKLRNAPVQHFYDVISNGYGAMFRYADRVAPADRWAIAAYIRALQTSAGASLSDVPPDKRQSLQ